MNRRYSYFKGNQDKDFYISSMKKYFNEKQEIDKFLEKLITPYIQSKKLQILDSCCGIGHLSYFLSEISPESNFLGIDQTPYLIEEAKKLNAEKKNISFKVRDIYDLPSKFEKFFDITLNWKTISWLPYYDECIRSLMKVTKNHIFLSSLFYDGYIDFEIKVQEFKKEEGEKTFNRYYNVYSLPIFEKFVYSLGARKVESFDFEINIDLPRSDIDSMGTYTLALKDQKRLQISGSILMTWKIIRIDL